MPKVISILGSTGSVGRSTLQVVQGLSDKIRVKYLTAARSWRWLVEQALQFRPGVVALVDRRGATEARKALERTGIEVLAGREGVLEIAGRDDVDLVVNAIVGSSGMEPTIQAVQAGVNVALSNKESLVMAGDIINAIRSRTGAEIYPVDSEHSAIWQCLLGEDLSRVKRLILTGSGGPFRTRALDTFSTISIREALTHPNWKMGKKITVDSATMMNKGLEVIEAHWLFDLDENRISIVIHPQSIIHSMVEFVDGSIKAQLGLPDMKIPIQYALTHPERVRAEWEEMDFPSVSPLTFEEPDLKRFPCIGLAYEALRRGGSAPAALNVANDNAVKHFLKGEIGFTEIAAINQMSLEEHDWKDHPNLAYLLELEKWGREFVGDWVKEGAMV